MTTNVHRTDLFRGHVHTHVRVRAAVHNTRRIDLGDGWISNVRHLFALLFLLRRGRLRMGEHGAQSRRHRSGMYWLWEDSRGHNCHRHRRGQTCRSPTAPGKLLLLEFTERDGDAPGGGRGGAGGHLGKHRGAQRMSHGLGDAYPTSRVRVEHGHNQPFRLRGKLGWKQPLRVLQPWVVEAFLSLRGEFSDPLAEGTKALTGGKFLPERQISSQHGVENDTE
mmetsp:Transcript_8724/g.14859  ORF Transcript_8724/g.14859 Transcript_8724/m.14859 type:complete len:222 (-) Transcript_8724:676-1341(-)